MSVHQENILKALLTALHLAVNYKAKLHNFL